MPAVIAYPWTDLTIGSYLYRMPGWPTSERVTVEQGQGDFAGELLVRNSPKFIPERLTNIPVLATFEAIDASDTILRECEHSAKKLAGYFVGEGEADAAGTLTWEASRIAQATGCSLQQAKKHLATTYDATYPSPKLTPLLTSQAVAAPSAPPSTGKRRA